MDLMTKLMDYPNIMAAAVKMGKIKRGTFNKKAYDAAEQVWLRTPHEELEKIDKEIAGTEPLFKTCIVTSGGIIYFSLNVLYLIPTRDVCWIYPRIIKNTAYYIITTGRDHQVWVVDRTGDRHLIYQSFTGPFSKKQPASDIIKKIGEKLYSSRPGIIFGYSKETDQAFSTNPELAASQIDAVSNQD